MGGQGIEAEGESEKGGRDGNEQPAWGCSGFGRVLRPPPLHDNPG